MWTHNATKTLDRRHDCTLAEQITGNLLGEGIDSHTIKSRMMTSEREKRFTSDRQEATDVVVVGAGLIGLALALELQERGASVTVIERGRSLCGASIAAAGMLAAEDPHNPAELGPLSAMSVAGYPAFLRRIEALSGIAVPFQTEATVQYRAGGAMERLAERSLDPRQLATALLAAVKMTPIRLMEGTQIAAGEDGAQGLKIRLTSGEELTAGALIYTAGAWTTEVMTGLGCAAVPIVPRKGQMLRLRLPARMVLEEVHRSEKIYVVPRRVGLQAGTVLVGASVEDAGFDTRVDAGTLARLRELASGLVEALGCETEAPQVEAWAGLRPGTPDLLPVLGACERERHFIASGHYRNGILLAPGTARVMADVLEGKLPALDISAFSCSRFRD